MNLMISLRAEMLKTKRTASSYLTVLGALIIPVIFVLDVCFDGISPENMKQPLQAFYKVGFTGLNLGILPFFIILVCTLLPQIEYRNNTWKQVFTSPQSMAAIFFSKFFNIQFLLIVFLVVFNISMMIGSVAINYIDPTIKLFEYKMDWQQLLMYNIRTYLCVAGISAIQFLIGLKTRNFIAPIAIGFVMWMIANLLVLEVDSPYAYLFPYAYSTMHIFPKFDSLLTTIQWSSVGYAILFLAVGYILFANRKVRS